jgi:hypothetical protein
MNTIERHKSEFIVTQSPMSFAGSFARCRRIVWKQNHAMVKIAVYGFLLPIWWTVCLAWFLGVLLIWPISLPYRLIRRSSRRRKLDDARHREHMDALKR